MDLKPGEDFLIETLAGVSCYLTSLFCAGGFAGQGHLAFRNHGPAVGSDLVSRLSLKIAAKIGDADRKNWEEIIAPMIDAHGGCGPFAA